MIIVGAGGFAKEILQVILDTNDTKNLVFFDDYNEEPKKVFDIYPVITSLDEAVDFFEREATRKYALGIGKPKNRELIMNKFSTINGNLTSIISKLAKIGDFTKIGNGATILSNCSISNSVEIGVGVLIYYNVVITHDCKVGDFVELSPGATLLGKVEIGDFSHIGANSTILPGIRIGKNVTVGAGAVVTKDVADNCVVAGVPAKLLKYNII